MPSAQLVPLLLTSTCTFPLDAWCASISYIGKLIQPTPSTTRHNTTRHNTPHTHLGDDVEDVLLIALIGKVRRQPLAEGCMRAKQQVSTINEWILVSRLITDPRTTSTHHRHTHHTRTVWVRRGAHNVGGRLAGFLAARNVDAGTVVNEALRNHAPDARAPARHQHHLLEAYACHCHAWAMGNGHRQVNRLDNRSTLELGRSIDLWIDLSPSAYSSTHHPRPASASALAL